MNYIANVTPLEQLLAQQRPGFSLDQPFYVNDEIYQLDLTRVLAKQWLYLDHVSNIVNPGDYLCYEFGDESIIVVRNKEAELHAHHNVCRHRGSKLCLQEQGHTKRLDCPYQAWTYNLDGDLLVAKQMNNGFGKRDYSLKPCRVEELEGLIFINIDPDDAPDFKEFRDNLTSFIKPHGIPDAKIVHTHNYAVEANWKLVVENFRECYHCSPSHPEYSSVNAYVKAGDQKLGSYFPEVEKWISEHSNSPFEKGFKNFPNHLQPHHAWRMPINHGFKTATQDGQSAGPLMGEFADYGYDMAETGLFFGPLSYFYFNNDHAVAFRVTPRGTQQTDVLVNWLVHKEAQENLDYTIDHLSWLWNITTIQDGEITENNQLGVNSNH